MHDVTRRHPLAQVMQLQRRRANNLSPASNQFDHDCRLSYNSESRTGSGHTVRNSNSGGDSFAEPYLYEPEVKLPQHLLQSQWMMESSTTQNR